MIINHNVRKRSREQLNIGSDSAAGVCAAVQLRFLLKWLMGKADKAAETLMRGIIFWISAVIEASAKIVSASDDPFDEPVLTGVKGRTLKRSQRKKVKVVKLGMQGDIFHSCRAVVRGLKILTKGGEDYGISDKSANKWTVPYIYQYVRHLQIVFVFSSNLVPVYSISWDATRLSKLDVLVSTVYDCGKQVAAWCPPQVFSSCCCCLVSCPAFHFNDVELNCSHISMRLLDMQSLPSDVCKAGTCAACTTGLVLNTQRTRLWEHRRHRGACTAGPVVQTRNL